MAPNIRFFDREQDLFLPSNGFLFQEIFELKMLHWAFRRLGALLPRGH
jgi:hypothetical protein